MIIQRIKVLSKSATEEHRWLRENRDALSCFLKLDAFYRDVIDDYVPLEFRHAQNSCNKRRFAVSGSSNDSNPHLSWNFETQIFQHLRAARVVPHGNLSEAHVTIMRPVDWWKCLSLVTRLRVEAGVGHYSFDWRHEVFNFRKLSYGIIAQVGGFNDGGKGKTCQC